MEIAQKNSSYRIGEKCRKSRKTDGINGRYYFFLLGYLELVRYISGGIYRFTKETKCGIKW
jgi:hypothetical protein